jgi:hypothetical protein
VLSQAEINASKPREKPYKLFDEHGLYLLVAPGGRRGWRIKYRAQGHEKLLSFGPLPYDPAPTDLCTGNEASFVRPNLFGMQVELQSVPGQLGLPLESARLWSARLCWL